MNEAIVSVCSKPGDAEKGNIEIRPAVPFVSEATYDSTEKDKHKFVDNTCRHSPSGADIKKITTRLMYEFVTIDFYFLNYLSLTSYFIIKLY